MRHEHDWQISVLLPVGWPSDRPIPMDAPTATYCAGCGDVFTGADIEETDDADRWHLIVENDNGRPYLSERSAMPMSSTAMSDEDVMLDAEEHGLRLRADHVCASVPALRQSRRIRRHDGAAGV